MDFSEVNRLFKADLEKVEQSIKENYQSDIPLIPGISSYMMNCGGKRLRPLLLLISSRLCGGVIDGRIVKHGCVVEYIHAATLLHDDVVDETTVRRGHETVNSKWGSDASILVGDFLISRAILVLAEDCDARIIRVIAEATKILVEGGILEFTHARDITVTEEHCLDVIYRKTASIISVSCQIGALLLDADEELEKTLVAFGNDFGMAFQLVDDAMDYDGDEESLGKPPGTDFKEGQITMPIHHLYRNGDEQLKKKIKGYIQNAHLSENDFDDVLEKMREHKSIDYTLDLARMYMERAKKTLRSATFHAPEYVDAMIAVTDHILDRHLAIKPAS